jgi:hypothetical protein
MILHKVVILFVDRIVCQMHELIIDVNLLGVSFTSKSSEAFLIYIDSQGLIRCHQNVYSEIEFVSVDQ